LEGSVIPLAKETKTKNVFLKFLIRFLLRMPNMVLNVSSLSEVDLLQFLSLNLYGFDPGLEAGSR
jgi:hypothetical protein